MSGRCSSELKVDKVLSEKIIVEHVKSRPRDIPQIKAGRTRSYAGGREPHVVELLI